MQKGIFGFFMDNYAERSSLGTIMGTLYIIPCVWHDKDGLMVSFLWKLWGQVHCARDTEEVTVGDLGRLSSSGGQFWLFRYPWMATLKS